MKLLLINNRYPTFHKPHIATFIKSIHDRIKACGISVDLLISDRNKLDGIPKILDTFIFYCQLFFFRDYKLYDILYINRFNQFGFLLHTRIKSKHKIIIHWHGSELRRVNLAHQFSFSLIKKRYFHIVPSNYYKDLLISKLNINSSHIFISPSGGVDLSLFYNNKNHSMSKVKQNKSIVLGFASGAKLDKGFDLVVKLIDDVCVLEKLTNKEISFNIIEYGKEKELLNKIINIKKVNIIKPMEKHKMPDFYNNCDILLFPTHYESLGLVGLEAIACDIPVLGTDCTSLPEYILSGKTGEVFQKSNYEDFISTLVRMINNIDNYSPKDYITNYSHKMVDMEYSKIFELMNKS